MSNITTDHNGANDVVDFAISHQFQRKVFDLRGDLGRIFVIYGDAGSLWYTSSSDDGETWATPTLLRDLTGTEFWYLNAAYSDFHVNPDDGKLHYAIAGPMQFPGPGNAIFYRRGTPQAGGSIIWDEDEQVAFTGDGSILEVGISTDSDGIPYITAEHFNDGSSPHPYPIVTRPTAADGLWTTDAGFPFQLSSTATQWWTRIERINQSGSMIAFYWHNNYGLSLPAGSPTIFARVWDGFTWGDEIEVSSNGPDRYGQNHIPAHAIVGDPDNGRAWAIYDQDYGQPGKIGLSFVDEFGDPSSGLFEIPTSYTTMALGLDPSGKPTMAYTYFVDSEATEIRVTRWDPNEGEWSESELIATVPGIYNSALQITENASMVAWQEIVPEGETRAPIRFADLSLATVDPPSNIDSPVVSGTPEVGQELSCTTGTWTNSPDSYHFQWYTGLASASLFYPSGEGAFYFPIGTDSSTYVLQPGDVGAHIWCAVTAANDGGSASKQSSNEIGPIASGLPSITIPRIDLPTTMIIDGRSVTAFVDRPTAESILDDCRTEALTDPLNVSSSVKDTTATSAISDVPDLSSMIRDPSPESVVDDREVGLDVDERDDEMVIDG